jgi:hypothetical protein
VDGNGSPEEYLQNMQLAVAVRGSDATSVCTGDDAKWASLMKGFKSAEGWKEGTTVTAANVNSLSTDAKDAPLIACYQSLFGVKP